MQAAVNYCSSDLGAKIVESSSNSANAEGVLSEREDSIWSAKAQDELERPYIVIQLPPHPAIRFVGWHVWQDYSSNPKVVEIAAGMSPNAVTDVVHCTALQGPGIQLWELSTPISSNYSYIRFRIGATFGSASTYMNRVFTFSQRPPDPSGSAVAMSPQQMNMSSQQNRSGLLGGGGGGGSGIMNSSSQPHNNLNSNFAAAPSVSQQNNINSFSTSTVRPAPMSNTLAGASASAAATSGLPGSVADPRAAVNAFEAGSPMHMSDMLRELDEDIRLLHPLPVDSLVQKTAAAANKSMSRPTVSPPQLDHYNTSTSFVNNTNTSLIGGGGGGNSSFQQQNARRAGSGGGGDDAVEELRREVAELRGQLAAERGARRAASAGGSSSVGGGGGQHHAMAFPQEELAELVDDIMQPKMLKWGRKLETRILMKVDETLKDLLGQITAAIDARVEQHMKHVIREHHKDHGKDECHICNHHQKHHHRKFSQASDDGSLDVAAGAPAAASSSSQHRTTARGGSSTGKRSGK